MTVSTGDRVVTRLTQTYVNPKTLEHVRAWAEEEVAILGETISAEPPKSKDLYISPESLEQLRAEAPSPEVAAELWRAVGLTEEQIRGSAKSEEEDSEGTPPVDGSGSDGVAEGPAEQPEELENPPGQSGSGVSAKPGK